MILFAFTLSSPGFLETRDRTGRPPWHLHVNHVRDVSYPFNHSHLSRFFGHTTCCTPSLYRIDVRLPVSLLRFGSLYIFKYSFSSSVTLSDRNLSPRVRIRLRSTSIYTPSATLSTPPTTYKFRSTLGSGSSGHNDASTEFVLYPYSSFCLRSIIWPNVLTSPETPLLTICDSRSKNSRNLKRLSPYHIWPTSN